LCTFTAQYGREGSETWREMKAEPEAEERRLAGAERRQRGKDAQMVRAAAPYVVTYLDRYPSTLALVERQRQRQPLIETPRHPNTTPFRPLRLNNGRGRLSPSVSFGVVHVCLCLRVGRVPSMVDHGYRLAMPQYCDPARWQVLVLP